MTQLPSEIVIWDEQSIHGKIACMHVFKIEPFSMETLVKNKIDELLGCSLSIAKSTIDEIEPLTLGHLVDCMDIV